MKKTSRLLAAAAAMVAVAGLTGCVDSNYDLSDIDTTSQVRVNDLVLPLNLDQIVLSDVIDLDEGNDETLRIIDGQYVVIRTGDFSSDPIHVNEVIVNRTADIQPESTDIYQVNEVPPTIPGLEPGVQTFTYRMTNSSVTPFTFNTNDVTENILSISEVGVVWTVNINIRITDELNAFQKFIFRDIVLQIPEGITQIEGYPINNGYINIEEITLDSSNHFNYTIKLNVTRINATIPETTGNWKWTAPYKDASGWHKGHIDYNGKVGVESGTVIAITKNTLPTVPGKVTLTTTPSMNDIRVVSFSGRMYYDISNFDVESVTLNDLPDFLTGEGTSISLANPQIYLSLTNPVAPYNLIAESGLTITPYRTNATTGTETAGTPCALDKKISIGADNGVGPYYFCLSPTKPDKYYINHPNTTQVMYPTLGKVLAGDGLPSQLGIDFDDPMIIDEPAHQAVDFPLGVNLPNVVKGEYTLYCPLQLGEGTVINYVTDEDGWSDETLEKVTIEKLRIAAFAESDVPFSVEITGWPVDINGQQCKDATTGKPITFKSIPLVANGKGDIVIETQGGNITNLDGIHLVALCKVSSNNASVLKPDLHLKLSKIRATISGFYLGDF